MAIKDFKNLEPNDVVNDLVDYIESKLPTFPSSNEFIHILEQKKNENQHSLSFCVYMTNECKSNYYFARENSQKGSSVIDIAVYKGALLIFTIEAKLLPTPKGNTSNPRAEHEYVHGKGAGIQRFKDGLHGRDNTDNLLNNNGLIGFIKEFDFEYWHTKVNQWIKDANWDNTQQLKKIHFNSFGRLLSTHPRTGNLNVDIHHFWVKVT